MKSFHSFCNAVLEETDLLLAEMGRPARGGVGVPREVKGEPGFAKKEKFGGQAGKYTGAQMLGFLGDFLKDHGDSQMDYNDLQSSLNTFLKNRGFGGTAANYWTRALGQTIFDFGHRIEKAEAEADNAGISSDPSVDDDQEVPPGAEDSLPTGSDEPSPEAAPEGEAESGAELDLTPIQQSLLDIIEGSEGPIDNDKIIAQLDRDLIPVQHAQSDMSIKSYVRSILASQLAGEKKLIKREATGWVPVPKQDSDATFDRDDSSAEDYDRAVSSELGNLQRWSSGGKSGKMSFEDSVDFTSLFKDSFKKLVD